MAELPAPFDPRRGEQSIWTGVVGAGFALGLTAAYCAWRISCPDGGPAVPVLFGFLPEPLRIRQVSRVAIDLPALLFLVFLFMAAWELAGRVRLRRTCRLTFGAVAAGTVWGAGTCRPGVESAWGLSLTAMEVHGLVSIGFFLLAAAFWGCVHRLSEKRRGGRDSPASVEIGGPLRTREVADAAPGSRTPWGSAFRSGTRRWLAMLIPFTLVVFLSSGVPRWSSYSLGTEAYVSWQVLVTALWLAFLLLGLPYCVWTIRVRGWGSAEFLDPGLILCLLYRSLGRLVRGAHAEPARPSEPEGSHRAAGFRGQGVLSADHGMFFLFCGGEAALRFLVDPSMGPGSP